MSTSKRTRRSSEVCTLDDGRRVRFSLKKRAGRPWLFVCFDGPGGERKERSTREKNRKRAQEAALAVIREAYRARPKLQSVSWDEAVKRLNRHMKAEGLRPSTVQQYALAVGTLRKLFPDTEGPTDVTPAMAEEFKARRIEQGLAPRTVRGNIENLRIVYGCWFRGKLKIADENPFQDVTVPKEDEKPARIIEPEEQKALFDWLDARWDWRLPILLLEVKAAIGCRIGELCSARTDALKDGRLTFVAETTKGRQERSCLLPADLFKELAAIAGPTYVFERFADELRAIHRRRGRPHCANSVKDFSPSRMKAWLQDEVACYFATTEAKRFKLHNFRGTAMSRARMAGITEDDAAIAFGCNPSTMRQHYLELDKVAVADDVFTRIQQGDIKGARGNGRATVQKNGTHSSGRKSSNSRDL